MDFIRIASCSSRPTYRQSCKANGLFPRAASSPVRWWSLAIGLPARCPSGFPAPWRPDSHAQPRLRASLNSLPQPQGPLPLESARLQANSLRSESLPTWRGRFLACPRGWPRFPSLFLRVSRRSLLPCWTSTPPMMSGRIGLLRAVSPWRFPQLSRFRHWAPRRLSLNPSTEGKTDG